MARAENGVGADSPAAASGASSTQPGTDSTQESWGGCIFLGKRSKNRKADNRQENTESVVTRGGREVNGSELLRDLRRCACWWCVVQV